MTPLPDVLSLAVAATALLHTTCGYHYTDSVDVTVSWNGRIISSPIVRVEPNISVARHLSQLVAS